MLELNESRYHLVANLLKEVNINNLFARTVVEKRVNGIIYVDDQDQPSTCYLVHPYGMSLLFGHSDNAKFNESFKGYALNSNKQRNGFEWMQVFPDTWENVLVDLFRGHTVKSSDGNSKSRNIIELNTRVNFKFNRDNYLKWKETMNAGEVKIIRIDEDDFDIINGSVVPMNFWPNGEQFFIKGVGFSVVYEDELVSTAFSAFIHERKLELGIETLPNYRGMKFAQMACAALIDFCLEHNYEPIWACRLENVGSYKLAIKLGFEHTLYLPYYKLGF